SPAPADADFLHYRHPPESTRNRQLARAFPASSSRTRRAAARIAFTYWAAWYKAPAHEEHASECSRNVKAFSAEIVPIAYASAISATSAGQPSGVNDTN